MKKLLFLLIALFFVSFSEAQVTAKKYLLIEHFTNSNCSTCASRNPALFNLIGQAQYADDVHHVTVHPMFPFQNCVFYQANKPENAAWTALYPIQGTPTLVLNGATQSPSNPLLSVSKLQTYLNQTSPLHVKVTETGPNAARMVTVTTKALDEIPAGDYKIFVAILEKTVNQTTGNGESVHRNVFRKMLTAVSGDDFTVPAAGQLATFNYEYSILGTWNPDEVYVLAFVKDVTTKQVLNSGTRFDPVLSSTQDLAPMQVQITPNPVSDFAWIDLADDVPQQLEVFASNGQRVISDFESQDRGVLIATNRLSPGIYYVRISGEKGVYVGKFVKS